MSDFELRAIGTAYKKQNNLLPYPVIVGDGNTPCNVIDSDIPGNILCRYVVSQNLFVPVSVGAPTGRMALSPGQPVELEYDNYGKLRIKGYDNHATLAQGGSPYANVVDSVKVSQSSIATLLVEPTQPPSKKVNVKSWYTIVNGIIYFFPGGQIDLTSLIPTSGNKAYVVVFAKNDYVTLEAKSSTPRTIPDIDLNLADIQEAFDARTSGSTAAFAIPLQDAQATITQTDIDQGADLRNLVNNTDASTTTASTSKTVANTASETTLLGTVSGSATFAANNLSRVGRTIRISAWGYISDTGTPTITVKFKLGSTVILTSGAVTLGSGISNKLWKFEGLVTIQTSGSSGQVIAQGQFTQNGTVTDMVNTAQIGVDLTAALTADLTAQWSAASASNTMTCTNFVMEVLN